MYAEVDTFIGNNTQVDPEIYQLWVEGLSAQEAVISLQQHGALQQFPGATVDLLLSDVLDHYRTYSMIEKLLLSPARFSEQWTFQIDLETQNTLIQKYYEFDDCVMREILGKKLSSRQRKDLDEVSEKTNFNLRSCRRQFDNAKRVFKTVEEMPGLILQNIKSQFCLQDDLAQKYAAVVFIAGNRFETSKRKLQYLTFNDFYNCAQSMMLYWSSPIVDDDTTADVEREFLMDLRELRTFLEKEKEHKLILTQSLKGKVTERIFIEIEHNFKVYSRTLINIAYGLNHSKELKDLFIDLVEKFIEPCKHLQWPLTDMKTFLQVYKDSALQMDILKSQPALKSIWKRYMDGIYGCIIAMYH